MKKYVPKGKISEWSVILVRGNRDPRGGGDAVGTISAASHDSIPPSYPSHPLCVFPLPRCKYEQEEKIPRDRKLAPHITVTLVGGDFRFDFCESIYPRIAQGMWIRMGRIFVFLRRLIVGTVCRAIILYRERESDRGDARGAKAQRYVVECRVLATTICGKRVGSETLVYWEYGK